MGTYRRERSKPYTPGQKEPYKLSRTRIDNFMWCQRCFWLEERLKIKRPSSPPFRINSAIDELLKKEFDTYRAKKEPHPMMIDFGLDAAPFAHDDLDKWRENFIGVQALHEPTNLLIFGAVDDVWVKPNGELIVVDYKATAKDSEVSIDSDWQIMYKRQLEVYQWLLRQNGFTVSDTGYFVYANGRIDVDGFFDKVEFRTKIIPYTGDASWVDKTLPEMKKCLEGDMPEVGRAVMGGECEYCAYAKARTTLTLEAIKKRK